MSRDFPIEDSPRCKLCKKHIAKCFCGPEVLDYQSLSIRVAARGENIVDLPITSHNKYIPGGEL